MYCFTERVEFRDQVISIPRGYTSFYYINKMRLITKESSQFKLNRNLIKVSTGSLIHRYSDDYYPFSQKRICCKRGKSTDKL